MTHSDEHRRPSCNFKGHTSQFLLSWRKFVLERAKIIATPDWLPAQYPSRFFVSDDDGRRVLRHRIRHVDGFDELKSSASDGELRVGNCVFV